MYTRPVACLVSLLAYSYLLCTEYTSPRGEPVITITKQNPRSSSATGSPPRLIYSLCQSATLTGSSHSSSAIPSNVPRRPVSHCWLVAILECALCGGSDDERGRPSINPLPYAGWHACSPRKRTSRWKGDFARPTASSSAAGSETYDDRRSSFADPCVSARYRPARPNVPSVYLAGGATNRGLYETARRFAKSYEGAPSQRDVVARWVNARACRF